MLDAEFFKSFRPFTAPWKQHNAALKWFRHFLESSEEKCIEFVQDRYDVATLIHGKEEAFTFNTNEMVVWEWKEMVCQLNDESMQYVVNGPENRSGGLVGCSFSVRKHSYDHKRHRALRKAGQEPVTDQALMVWDFVLHRADHTAVRLHPQWSTTKIESFPVQGYAQEVEPPYAGKGKSDGPGTFVWYNEIIGNARTLRFDGNKRPS